MSQWDWIPMVQVRCISPTMFGSFVATPDEHDDFVSLAGHVGIWQISGYWVCGGETRFSLERANYTHTSTSQYCSAPI